MASCEILKSKYKTPFPGNVAVEGRSSVKYEID